MSAPSFSTTRKLTMVVNVALAVISALALLLMVNYLAARHFTRFSLSSHQKIKLSPYTLRILDDLTNNHVNVIVYFDKEEALSAPVLAWLKEYKFACPKIGVETVDFKRDPTRAAAVEAKYKLNDLKKKNVVIFDSDGRPPRIVFDSELSELDLQPLVSGKSQEVKRTHLKCEMMFTSALLAIGNTKPLKACVLQGHMEQRLDSDDRFGYSMFANILRQNNIDWMPITLIGSAEIPADCSLLIIAGPSEALLNEELEKIDRYLKQGGRALVLFKPAIFSPQRLLGLEKLLANWGVEVGLDAIEDPKLATNEKDILLRQFKDHPIVKPLTQTGLYLVIWPRSVGKLRGLVNTADTPKVEVLAETTSTGHEMTDISSDGSVHANPKDFVGRIPLMVAVEKGSIRGMAPDRGLTRLVVVGESLFLNNQSINSAGNREFLNHSLNWLLARNELVTPIGPQPIKEYKLLMSATQLAAVRWTLLLGFPGAVLLIGLLVSLRRRK
jgi:ABC-2 type transport system permease protein